MLQFLPYALAAYGGYKGYQGAKQSGASGIGRLLGAAGGAYGGYTLGSTGMSMFPGSTAATQFAALPLTKTLSGIPGVPQVRQPLNMGDPAQFGLQNKEQMQRAFGTGETSTKGGSLLDLLRKKDSDEYDPLKVSAAAALIPYALGAFDQAPTDIYMPGYNVDYLELQKQRPGYTYIDPTTGEEKAYEKVYAPEQQGLSDRRMGPYSLNVQRLNTGGIAEIQKFNEGGVNYLPSKVSHDENDANNYVRASGYVEDGSGNGDKDEDTMLAQLADGEFVTRADGVLGAGIIAGANPNSMKDMREKGAKYFYEQQARYKRVFDLLKEKNGDSKQKTN